MKAYTVEELQATFGKQYQGHLTDPRGGTSRLDDYCKVRDNHAGGPPSPYVEPTTFSAGHIDGRVRQVESLRDQLDAYLGDLKQQILSVETTICSHLWIDETFGDVAHRGLDGIEEIANKLRGRVDAVAKGFAALPRLEDDAGDHAPQKPEQDKSSPAEKGKGTGAHS